MSRALPRAAQELSRLAAPDVGPGPRSFDEIRRLLGRGPLQTLLTRDFLEAMLALLPVHRQVLATGDWVQVGVWRGGGALFLRAAMQDLSLARPLHLYDTFGPIPVDGLGRAPDLAFVREFGLQDPQAGGGWSRARIEALLAERGLRDGVLLHEGDVRVPGPADVPREIALLHIDVDFYEPTLAALRRFYHHVVPGGLVIIDDYFMELLACRAAVDDFIRELGEEPATAVSRLSSQAALIIRKAG